jgi:NitT/TauT family transport system permease protein/taurine transport system permease protein
LTKRALAGLVTMLIVVALWFATTQVAHLVSPGRFPSPLDVYKAAVQIGTPPGYAGATLAHHVIISLELVFFGFLAATVTGVPLGLGMGLDRRFEAFVNPIFLAIRPIPPLAWIPLAVVWFGLGIQAKIFVVWFAAFVPALINTYTGVRTVDNTLIDAARVHGASHYRIIREVVIPASLPHIFTGLRLSLQASWTTLIAAELVGAVAGIGHVLIVASLDIYPGMILYGMAWVALLGAIMTLVLGRLERVAMPWLR